MFMRQQSAQGGAYWQSSLLDAVGVPHAFSTRSWDVKTADEVLEVVAVAGGFAATAATHVILARQVHGCLVTLPGRLLAEADAHVTDDPQAVVAVRTADCVSVLLSTADGSVVAAIHAGWRGLDPEVGVIGKAVGVLREVAGDSACREGLVAAIGPCISVERYEVGPDVADRFRERTPQAVRDDLGKKPHLDTRAVAVAQLIEAGLVLGRGAIQEEFPRELTGKLPGGIPKEFPGGGIDVFGGCTFGDAGDCFSYRRDGPGMGHLAAMIGPKAH